MTTADDESSRPLIQRRATSLFTDAHFTRLLDAVQRSAGGQRPRNQDFTDDRTVGDVLRQVLQWANSSKSLEELVADIREVGGDEFRSAIARHQEAIQKCRAQVEDWERWVDGR